MSGTGTRRSFRMNGKIDRRTVLAGAGAGALVLGTGQGALARSSRFAAPAYLRYQDSGNLPTPREQTVVVEEAINNIWDSFNPYIANGENGAYGLAHT
ncbi:MAG: hypothetical protein ACTHMX_15315 [Thermomicrobiales bacterium]